MLPDLRTSAGFDALREAGYGFNNFDRPQNFKMQAEILDLAVKTAGSLTAEPEIVSDTAYLVLDSLLNAPRGFEFFPRFPKEEVVQFCRLAVASREQQSPLPVVCPVCPDYPDSGGFKLRDGIGYSAHRALDNLGRLFNCFQIRNFSVNLHILVADVEALNPILLVHSGETYESFLFKTQKTQAAIQAEIDRLRVGEMVGVGSMLAVFNDMRVDYFQSHSQKTVEIKASQSRKTTRVRQSLLDERKKEHDFDDFTLPEQENAVAMELADYSVFGDLVDGRAVILSPDAASAVPAYNSLRTGHDGQAINPTIYLKNVKEYKGSEFYV